MCFSGYPAGGFPRWSAYILPAFSFPGLFSGSQMGVPLLCYITFSFILAYARCPSSTCRVDLSRTDICPISLIPKLLEMIHKA